MRIVVLCFSLTALLLGCSTVSHADQNNNSDISTTTSQNKTEPNIYKNIDEVFYESSQYLAERISQGAKIAIVSIQSPTINLSNYAVNSISMHLVNKNKFTIIERTDLDTIKKEQSYQTSGAVSDETAVSIGKQIGAQFIVTGSVLPIGDKYSFQIKIINAETTQNYGTKIYHFNQDKTMLALLTPPIPTISTPSVVKEPVTREDTQRPIINGDVNITNNNTTTINGDVYVNKPEWFNKNSIFD